MTIYHIDPNGEEKLDPDHFSQEDKTLTDGEAAFARRVGVTAGCMRRTFIGKGSPIYDYLLSSGLNFYIVTHPWVTFSCQDKIDMYNTTNCTPDGNVGKGKKWKLEDTVKAIYFWHKGSKRYHIAVVPGKPTGTYIDIRSFSDICKGSTAYGDDGFSARKQIRLFPTEQELAFGVMQEGCFSPLPPYYANVTDESGNHNIVRSTELIDAMYFDQKHLVLYEKEESDENKIDDLSIAMTTMFCREGEFFERKLRLEAAQELKQFVDGKQTNLDIIKENNRRVAYVKGPLFGDYRDATTKGDDVVLKFSYIPNHMLSLVMNHKALYGLLRESFSGKVHAIDMQYC